MILDRKDSEKATSVVGDVRKLFQDFLAPELRELKVRLDSMEKRTDDRFDAVHKRMDEGFAAAHTRMGEGFAATNKRIDEIEQRNAERHAEILEAIRESDKRMDRRVETILDFTAMREKVAVLEAERQARQRAAS